MRNLSIAALLSILTTLTFAQQTTVSWQNQGKTRQYIQYVPASYTPSTAVPLVIAMHGLGDNMNNFSGIGMQQVADTANFIVVYPQGLKAFNPLLASFFGPDSITAWNSGAGALGMTLSPDVSDVEFINALIDTLSAHYSIDQSKIYATGFSMGAFMTNRLACELPRISKIASVAGTIGGLLSCDPGRSVPACHFHGTADPQVGYGTPEGASNNFLGLNVNDWVSFWAENNGCGAVSMSGALPNSANDGFTVEYLEYAGCDENSRVARYKVNGAEHVWLGPGNDISYTREIWKFFRGQSPTLVGIEEQALQSTMTLYPNPAVDRLFLSEPISDVQMVRIVGIDGRIISDAVTTNIDNGIDISGLDTGAYMLQLNTERGVLVRRFVKLE
jgi:polyhydroxybutyrate depolymerase